MDRQITGIRKQRAREQRAEGMVGNQDVNREKSVGLAERADRSLNASDEGR